MTIAQLILSHFQNYLCMTYISLNCVCWSNNIKANMLNVGCKCIMSPNLQSSMNMYGDILGLAAD